VTGLTVSFSGSVFRFELIFLYSEAMIVRIDKDCSELEEFYDL